MPFFFSSSLNAPIFASESFISLSLIAAILASSSGFAFTRIMNFMHFSWISAQSSQVADASSGFILTDASRALIQDRQEAAEDHPFAIEELHGVAQLFHPGIFEHLLFGGVADFLGWVLDPRDTTLSLFSAFTARKKSVVLPCGTSSLQHSTCRIAPHSLK